jgi:ERF superfamily protein
MAKKAKTRPKARPATSDKTITVPLPKTQALARVEPEPAQTPLAIIERVARDKTVDVAKLAALVELQKDMMRVQAKIDFDQAFAAMAPQLPTITKRGKIAGKNRPTIGYARLGEDIHPAIKPVLSRNGFAIRHRTEWPAPGQVRVIGILSHRGGHSEQSAFEGPADASDYRSHVQSLGSTVSYGRRYTTVDLLNLTVLGQDDDGSRSPRPSEPPPASRHPHEQEPITDPQRKRLFTIAKAHGRTEPEIKAYLAVAYNITSTKDLKRVNYDAVIEAIEAEGPMGRADAPRDPDAILTDADIQFGLK